MMLGLTDRYCAMVSGRAYRQGIPAKDALRHCRSPAHRDSPAHHPALALGLRLITLIVVFHPALQATRVPKTAKQAGITGEYPVYTYNLY
jgi:hypothetical protein